MSRILSSTLLAAASLTLIGCASLNPHPTKIESRALPSATGGMLAEVSDGVRQRFGSRQSGFHLLTDAEEAMRWRLALVDHATRSIDIQYYIWEDDESGRLLMTRLLDAADRGVRVRLLVDDFPFKGDEEKVAAVCHHPNFEIRVFNPQLVRNGIVGPALEFASNFGRLNRRMHNKLFVADKRMGIMGGRNIGNVYFGLGEKYNFVDLDVLAAGPIVPEIAQAFDEFWNSDPAYPGEALSPSTGPDHTAAMIAAYREAFTADPGILRETNYPLKRADWRPELRSLKEMWHPGTAMVLQDQPVTKKGVPRRRFLDHSPSLLDDESPEELIFVSPYLVPGKQIYESIAEHTENGAVVKLISPGLDSTDSAVVHSHYKKHRRRLLEEGARLHELREDSSKALSDLAVTEPARTDVVALHLKGAVGDRTRCFIGSLNLDPRSIEINTENGLFIESPGLAKDLARHFEMLMATENAWEVTQEEDGGLRWRSRGEERRIQPAPNFPSRVSDFFFGLLPIKNLL